MSLLIERKMELLIILANLTLGIYLFMSFYSFLKTFIWLVSSNRILDMYNKWLSSPIVREKKVVDSISFRFIFSFILLFVLLEKTILWWNND
jgi:hypothetical protein